MDEGQTSNGPRAAPGRVAAVQRQVRPTLAGVVLFLLAAAVGGAVSGDTGRWLPLHLALAGALVLAVSGATQFLAVTWGAAAPPPRRAVVAQRWLVGAGAIAVAAGRDRGFDALTVAGGTAVALGLVALVVLLVRIGASAVQPRVRPALVAYIAAAGCGVAGVALGAVLAGDGAGAPHARLRDVHVTLNLLGFAGFVVAGTLPFFLATQAKVKVSPRATRRAQFGIQVAMALGLAATVAGLLTRTRTLAAAGLASYGAAVAGLVPLLPRLGMKQLRWAGPRLVQAGAAIAWWIGAVGLACAHAARGRAPYSGSVVPALVIGAYVQLLVAALSYLGPVLVGGGHERLAASFRVVRSWPGLAAGNVAAIAACATTARIVYVVAIAVWALDGATRAGMLFAARLPTRRNSRASGR